MLLKVSLVTKRGRGASSTKRAAPEGLVARGVGAAQADVAEAGDAGVTRREVAPPAVLRAHDELDAVAGEIGEVHEAVHPALLAGVGAAALYGQSEVADLTRGSVQRRAVTQFEAHAVVLRVAFDVDQGVVAVVAAVVAGAGLLARQFQPDHLAREAVGRGQVTRAEPNVADVEQVDQGGSPSPEGGARRRRNIAGPMEHGHPGRARGRGSRAALLRRAYTRSSTSAMPCPTPMHMVHSA
jgi:hypothetical protein